MFLTAGPGRCDALILTGNAAEPVQVIKLNQLTQHDALARVHQLLAASRTATDNSQPAAPHKAAQGDILDVLAWLWDTVAEPVLTALGHTTSPRDGQAWPRIWWCPVGIMGYLPLHAAGHHRDLASSAPAVAAAPRTVLDRVISSYTPTVRALGYARSHPPATANATLIIAVPDAPGTRHLPGVIAEANTITSLIPGAQRPGHPVRADVLAALPTHPVAHFSCHGLADWDDPAASRLILYDHQTNPLTVAEISALHVTLAFCQSATPHPPVPALPMRPYT